MEGFGLGRVESIGFAVYKKEISFQPVEISKKPVKGPVSLGIHLSINTFLGNIYSLSRITFLSFVLYKWGLCRMLWALLLTISTQQCHLINLKSILDAHISQFCSHYIMGGLQPGLISPWFLLLLGVLIKELWWGAVSLSLFDNNWTLHQSVYWWR